MYLTGIVAAFAGMQSRFVGEKCDRVSCLDGHGILTDDIACICIQTAWNIQCKDRT